MAEKPFTWTEELTIRMLQLKFDNDRLFKLRKQPWAEFYNILLEHGFPNEVTNKQVQKKWGYIWDMYKIAKRENNTTWKYYEMFDKQYGKTQELGKYESWSNEWRLRLITCISAAKEHNMDHNTMWRTVEKAMRCQDMPEDCCVQDMQGLWQHLKITFLRKHRYKTKRGAVSCEWPLYEAMRNYYENYEALGTISGKESYRSAPGKTLNRRKDLDSNDLEQEFIWTKDITESFIQVRLQNDWLFNQRLQAWKDFIVILREEYGFPRHLTPREASRKWSSIFSEYHKAKATKYTSWIYYNLFEVYLGEGTLSINPLFDWQENWAMKLIRVRTSYEEMFLCKTYRRYPNKCWREVEKSLRSDGIPLDHSLLDLNNIWIYLIKTYKWKKKYADKGVLKEQWPYYDAMVKYMEVNEKLSVNVEVVKGSIKFDEVANDNYDGEDDDDIKLFDLKQKMELKESKPLTELGLRQCRACGNDAVCDDIFQEKENSDDINTASKLMLVGGILVEKSDNLPAQICYDCLRELENAYKFRRKCQTVDKQFRVSPKHIKIEILEKMDGDGGDTIQDDDVTIDDNDDLIRLEDTTLHSTIPESRATIPEPRATIPESRDSIPENTVLIPKTEKLKKERVKKKYVKRRYDYWKVCEICGKHTKNLKSHVDTHNMEKPYSCEVCGKKFKFRNGMIVHKAVHEEIPRKTCEICGKTFHILAHFKRHSVYHANERRFACDACGQRFNSLDILRVHKRIHTGERPFNCSDCGKTFRTAGCVSRHKRIVHRSSKNLYI